jgi:hypothetical protein
MVVEGQAQGYLLRVFVDIDREPPEVVIRHIPVGGGVETAVASNTAAEALSTLIVSLPLPLYSLFILRRVAPLENWTIWR